MKTCKKCGNTRISDTTTVCPQCGSEDILDDSVQTPENGMDEKPVLTGDTEIREKNEQSAPFIAGIIAFLAIVVLVLAVIGILVMLSGLSEGDSELEKAANQSIWVSVLWNAIVSGGVASVMFGIRHLIIQQAENTRKLAAFLSGK